MNEWIKVEDKLPTQFSKVLALYKTEAGKMYNMRHDGWFRNTVYSCRFDNGSFIIESHGPLIPATHWMICPDLPKEE